ncbi:hypothetical protein QEN19_004117 [Hanseniaspora menglaensis]
MSKSEDIDKRSIFIKNLTHNVDAQAINVFFELVLKNTNSEISRVTIVIKNKNRKLLHGYVEFTTEEAQKASLSLDNSELDGVKVRIYSKRTNLPQVMINYEQDEDVMMISSSIEKSSRFK